jgi:hypothetical protein
LSRAAAVSLSDRQLRLVMQHAAGLPLALRDRFLQRIADHLRGEPSDSAVAAAVNAALDSVHAFMEANSSNDCCG